MKRSIKNAVILAGGLGTRLKPYTDNYPKPMYPVDGMPFIERLIYPCPKIPKTIHFFTIFAWMKSGRLSMPIKPL